MSEKSPLKIILSLVVLLGAIAYSVSLSLRPSDFDVYLRASEWMLSGKSPYNEWFFVKEGHYCLYFYSPFWAMFLAPLSYLPDFLPKFVWLLANIFFLFRIWKLLSGYVDLSGLSSRKKQLLLLFSVLLSIRFILYNFEMLQMTIFLLWGCLESMRLIRRDQFILGGLLLAAIINIKLMPLVLLPYLLYRAHYKAFASTLVWSIVFLLVPALLLGWSDNLVLLQDWWSSVNPTNMEHAVEVDPGLHSLTALVPLFFLDSSAGLDATPENLTTSTETINLITNMVRLGLIASTLFILKWPPFKRSHSKLQLLKEIAFILLLIPLIFPHQQKYAFLLTLPAQFFLLYELLMTERFELRSRLSLILLVFSFILMTCTTDGLIGSELYAWTQHYKLVTFGSLFLIVGMFFAGSQSTNQ